MRNQHSHVKEMVSKHQFVADAKSHDNHVVVREHQILMQHHNRRDQYVSWYWSEDGSVTRSPRIPEDMLNPDNPQHYAFVRPHGGPSFNWCSECIENIRDHHQRQHLLQQEVSMYQTMRMLGIQSEENHSLNALRNALALLPDDRFPKTGRLEKLTEVVYSDHYLCLTAYDSEDMLFLELTDLGQRALAAEYQLCASQHQPVYSALDHIFAPLTETGEWAFRVSLENRITITDSQRSWMQRTEEPFPTLIPFPHNTADARVWIEMHGGRVWSAQTLTGEFNLSTIPYLIVGGALALVREPGATQPVPEPA